MSESQQREAYEAILSKKNEFGFFKKTCFHLHTPESHDYRLLDSWDSKTYKSKSDQDILNICYDYRVLPSTITLDYFDDTILTYYKSKKEFLSFLLLANEILKKQISIIIVTDHHTILGVKKLEKAIHYLHVMKAWDIYPEVLLGIEISCADRNHVVGIFEKNDKIYRDIESWLDLHLFNEVDGSFETSKEVLAYIKNEGGIGYIAHIDTSNTFGEKFLTGAYKRKLFEDLDLIGISDINKINYIKMKIRDFSSTSMHFIIDNDSHDINSLGKKYMWIKGQNRTFQTIKEAFSDYDICVSYQDNISMKSYIKGIYITNSEHGFLCGKKGAKQFCLNFSKELNCFIGGRGTGKSTVLELIEYALSQRCKSHDELSFLCAHGNTFILYEFCGSEFLIELYMPIQGENDDILRYFGQNLENRYKYYYSYNNYDIKEYTLKHYIDVFRIYNNGDDVLFEKQSDKRNLLRKFFDTRYSVNELVSTASDNSINAFLYDILFENKTLSSPEAAIRIRSISGLEKMLSGVQNALGKRMDDVRAVIEPFNNAQAGILRIVYSQNNIVHEPPIGEWIWGRGYDGNQYYSINKKKYNITYDSIEQYLLTLYLKLGIFNFLDVVLKRDIVKIQQTESIYNFCNEMTMHMIDDGVLEINGSNVKMVYGNLLCKVITDSNFNLILDYLKTYVNEIESFSLEFNINNHESTKQQKALYKDVRHLSLGQKVVAMLSFILGYSDYSNDYRPLIIDQPEDNLDNQYIYKNLVKQLRDAKGKRQVIIATHSATLVTNTKAEQVCVMCSDGTHGWVDVRGFTGEAKIKKNIINYLEGGAESFRHKVFVYNDVLNKI